MRIETNRLIISEFTMDMASDVCIISLDKANRRFVQAAGDCLSGSRWNQTMLIKNVIRMLFNRSRITPPTIGTIRKALTDGP